MLGENFNMQDSEDIEYDIDKSIEQILDDDYLWNEFYNNINADLVKKEE